MSCTPAQGPAVVAERCRVISIERLTATIAELWLAPARPFVYLPGQYVVLEGPSDQAPPRSYSIGNIARPDGLISLLVRDVPGGKTSKWVHEQLRAGGELQISGPYGSFIDQAGAAEPRLFLAAGSGLAPIRALIEAALSAEGETGGPITLLFSTRTGAEAIDRDRFEVWQREHLRFRVIATLTRQDGRPLHGRIRASTRRDAPPLHGRIPSLLAGVCPDLCAQHVYIAGSAGFVTACRDAAAALGSPRTHLHTEPFFVEPEPWQAQPRMQGAP